MQQNIHLSIPEPCHEDWNKMTTTQQGRYCQSCCKQVVDFTAMSDQQIIDYLSNAKDKTCGRFNTNQLEQPLQESRIIKKSYWKWILTSIAALFFFFDKASAQKKQPCTTTKGEIQQTKTDTIKMMGDVSIDTIKTKPYQKMGKIAVYPKNKNKTEADKRNKNQK